MLEPLYFLTVITALVVVAGLATAQSIKKMRSKKRGDD